MTDVVEQARLFSIAAHGAIGQVRKYTGEPYAEHCRKVAMRVWNATFSDDATAAAYLHDILEDTAIPPDLIRREFGGVIADLVLQVTDVSRPEDGNREIRKAIDRAHNARASALGQTIKVADLIDNSRSITAHDPGFAKVYMADKRALLKVLTLADPTLREEAWRIVQGYEGRQGTGP